jgi:hypothetical protein
MHNWFSQTSDLLLAMSSQCCLLVVPPKKQHSIVDTKRSFLPNARCRLTEYFAERPTHSVNHICTPQNPLPPQTPNVPIPGAQLKLPTSYLHSHTADGPRSCAEPPPPGAPGVIPAATLPVEVIRSQSSTQQSSAPEASTPRCELLQSTQFTDALCPLSSRSACPGCRTSSTRMIFESCEKVARRCASCGEAAIRSSGGGNESDCEPEPRVGDAER